MSQSSKALSLYRSLLREATYLPDEAARSYFRHWIVHRFHAASKLDTEELSKARKTLNRLERANYGDSKALIWVLDNTYGRIGKRRRELIENVRANADEHLLFENYSELKRHRHTGKSSSADNRPPVKTKLQALITSHKQTAPPAYTPRTQIRKDEPNIPATNAWGRPTPLKLRAGMERRWLASTLDKLLPPLPRDEHERLYNLAMGITPFPGLPPRRASKAPPQKELISQREIARFLQPIEHVEKIPFEESYKNHNITGRFMQRLWMRVLRLCPVMIQNETTKLWDVQWVRDRSLPITSVVTTASISDLELFEGSSANATPQKGGRNRNKKRLQ